MPDTPQHPTLAQDLTDLWQGHVRLDQDTVDLAQVLVLIADARDKGIMHGGPAINGLHCETLLAAGKVLGITPRHDAMTRLLPAFLEPDLRDAFTRRIADHHPPET